MKAAADCNTFNVCFPVAMIYCAVEGTTSRLSDGIWIQMFVSDKAGYELILSPSPWNSSPEYLVPPQKYTPSLPRRSLLHFQAIPGWMKMWVREFAGYESIFSPPPWNSSPKLGPPQRYTRSLPRRSLLHSQAVPGRR